MKVATGCYNWIIFTGLFAVLFGLFALANLAFLAPAGIAALAALFLAVFFRDPERKIGEGIVAPADGKISRIDHPEEGYVRICTFMNVHNVHVNRAPMSGKVISVEHIDGKHIPAFDKDSDTNERVIIVMDTKIGNVKIVQIAGAFARRIVPYIEAGHTVEKGERIGIIRLGSRVDLWLPKEKVNLKVKEGDRVKAGETTIAEYG
ncbi:MAG: phosphatidylserine decarboxylase family protein [Thermoplasmata archaeon HGW-Thermoplasmata-2]|nr:MAG: phosphatidylserine decarboxylase family protein [Thermoplasmata archaeon HGW-Thermoplasmata-2]